MLGPLAEDDISVDFVTQNLGTDGRMSVAFSVAEALLAPALASLQRRFPGEDPGRPEVHVEAGYKLNGSLLREGLVDELLIYLAPSLIGDRARGMFDLPALESLSAQRTLRVRDVRMIESDIRIIARAA